MLDFFSKTCIALTWNEQGSCRGVRMVRRGNHLAVVGHWLHPAAGEADIATLLHQGAQTLGLDRDTPLVVGSTGYDIALTDLNMPALDPENLRRALRFELNKQAPVNQDKLTWGFRVIGSDEHKRLLVRLVYMPEARWQHLVDGLGSLTGQVDAIMPVPAALDPVLADIPLFIGAEDNRANGGCIYMPGKAGRELLYLDADKSEDTAFGAGDRPLALEGLNIGELASLPIEEQRSFAGAAVLAMYGTSPALRNDRKTWFRVPEELRSRHHFIARRVAVLLGLYIGLVGVFGFGRGYIEGVRYLRDLHSREQEFRRRIEQLTGEDNQQQLVTALSEELQELDLARPTLLQALVELTDKIPDEYWVAYFNWQEGRIELQIQSDQDDLTFLEQLRASPVLRDVLPIRKTVDHENNVTFQVQMRTVPGRPLIRSRDLNP